MQPFLGGCTDTLLVSQLLGPKNSRTQISPKQIKLQRYCKNIQCNFDTFYECPTFHCNSTVLFTFNCCSKYSTFYGCPNFHCIYLQCTKVLPFVFLLDQLIGKLLPHFGLTKIKIACQLFALFFSIDISVT